MLSIRLSCLSRVPVLFVHGPIPALFHPATVPFPDIFHPRHPPSFFIGLSFSGLYALTSRFFHSPTRFSPPILLFVYFRILCISPISLPLHPRTALILPAPPLFSSAYVPSLGHSVSLPRSYRADSVSALPCLLFYCVICPGVHRLMSSFCQFLISPGLYLRYLLTFPSCATFFTARDSCSLVARIPLSILLTCPCFYLFSFGSLLLLHLLISSGLYARIFSRWFRSGYFFDFFTLVCLDRLIFAFVVILLVPDLPRCLSLYVRQCFTLSTF